MKVEVKDCQHLPRLAADGRGGTWEAEWYGVLLHGYCVHCGEPIHMIVHPDRDSEWQPKDNL